MITQTDAYLKVLLESTLEDIRNNIWLLDYILDDFTSSPFLKKKYGEKQIIAAKDWFKSNNLNIFHNHIKDKDKYPAIVITLGTSQESQDHRTMSDVDQENLVLMPNQVGKQIPYVIKPFIPTSYDDETGLVGVPVGTDLGPISQGMVLVNPSNGNGFVIEGVVDGQIQIQSGIETDASQFGVIPQYRFFTTRLGRSFFRETWHLTCATNDAQSLLWLHSIVTFGLLRYRELYEREGVFQIENLASTDIFNPEFSDPEGEEIFCRQVTITNLVEQKFIRVLHRTIESMLLRDQNPEAVTLANPSGFTGGVKILSNLDTPALEQDDSDWFTIEDSE